MTTAAASALPAELLADLAASYQRAIVEALAGRVERALEATGLQALAIGGGVAANSALRDRLAGIGVQLTIPPAVRTNATPAA